MVDERDDLTMSLFVSSADAVSGNFTKLATKASLWTTTWPLWEHFEGNAHPNDPDPACAVPIIWLRHDRSLGLMRGAACVLCKVEGMALADVYQEITSYHTIAHCHMWAIPTRTYHAQDIPRTGHTTHRTYHAQDTPGN